MAEAFDAPLAHAGSELVSGAGALGVGAPREQFAAELECWASTARPSLRYRGERELADPAAWDRPSRQRGAPTGARA